MRGFGDTIVAPITGAPPCAVAVVRLSGPDSWAIAAEVFPSWPLNPESHLALYGRYFHGDDGLALPFAQGRSYTGEETVEFSIHGSAASIDRLVSECVKRGARRAEPGEFTLRAFLNGRMDLTQAESVADLVESQTQTQLRASASQRDGSLRRVVGTLREELEGLLAAIEASVDFSEEVGELDSASATRRLRTVAEGIQNLQRSAKFGRLLRSGYRIAIVGPPNAGKSSLLNALLGTERAIVTPLPGTTRDYVEERADFDGYPVVLVDTAGLRETSDPVEEIGIGRSLAASEAADEVWYVYDAAVGWSDDDEARIATFDRPVTIIGNKSDLAAPSRGRPVSAATGSGLDELVALVRSRLEVAEGSGGAFVNDRHESELQSALDDVRSAEATLEAGRPDDLAAVGIRAALEALGRITGETATPDILDRIFRDFCIGK